MPTQDELKVLFEKLAAGTATDEELEAIHKACAGSDKITVQIAKYINNVNQAQDSQEERSPPYLSTEHNLIKKHIYTQSKFTQYP